MMRLLLRKEPIHFMLRKFTHLTDEKKIEKYFEGIRWLYTSLGLVIRFYYVVGNGSNILEKRPDVVKTQASNHLQFQEQFRNVTLLTTKKKSISHHTKF